MLPRKNTPLRIDALESTNATSRRRSFGGK